MTKSRNDTSGATARTWKGSYGPLTIKPNEVWWAEVYCPAGMWPMSGGESNNSAGGVILHSSEQFMYAHHGWKVTVSNRWNMDATFSVWVVCFGGLSSIRVGQWYTYVQPNSQGGRVETCDPVGPEQQLVGGGGFSDTTNMDIPAAYPIGSKEWSFEISNYDSVQRQAWAHAVCTTGIGNYQIVRGPFVETMPGQIASSVAVCPPGTVIVGGGGYGSYRDRITDSYPVGEGWRVYMHNRGQQPGWIRPHAICGT